MAKKNKAAAKKIQQNNAAVTAAVKPAVSSGFSFSFLEKFWALIICLILLMYYILYSIKSDGFYQHDEVGHFFDILQFWDKPIEIILGLWSRGGYKLLYAIPSLFGYHAVLATNILFSIGSAWLAYLISKQYKLKFAWLAILFTGLQPFVINLSFRCYAEVPAMFFTTLMVYLFNNKKYVLTAIVASFIFSIRQELAVFAVFLGIFFLFNKKWLPFLFLATFPVLLDIVGWIYRHDSLYVFHMLVQGGINDQYKRNGFFYLWMMLPEISGIVITLIFLVGYFSFVIQKEKWKQLKKYAAPLIVFTVYFLMHCMFTSKSFGFGRSGGLGRFLLVILPMMAVIAMVGINFLISNESKLKKLISIVFAAATIFTFLYMIDKILPLVYYGFNVLALVQKNWSFAVLTAIFLVLMVVAQQLSKLWCSAIAVTAALYCFICVTPLYLTEEDQLFESVVSWTTQQKYEAPKIHFAHPMYKYFYMLEKGEDYRKLSSFDSLQAIRAKPKEIFIFDNHYTGKLITPHLLDSLRFRIIKEFHVQDTAYKFGVWILQK